MCNDLEECKVKWIVVECDTAYEVAETLTKWDNNRGKMELIESKIVYTEMGQYSLFLRLIYDPAVGNEEKWLQ